MICMYSYSNSVPCFICVRSHDAYVHTENVCTFSCGDRKRELMYLNVSFNNIEYLPPELGDLVLLK